MSIFKSFHKTETSKKVLWLTCVCFIFTLVAGIWCVYKNKDTSFFMYALPSAGGVFGATIVFI